MLVPPNSHPLTSFKPAELMSFYTGAHTENTLHRFQDRLTRLTNGFSKKVEHHACQVALHFMHCNFGRIHKMLRMTPAIVAGVTDRLWAIQDIVNVMPAPVAKKTRPEQEESAMKNSMTLHDWAWFSGIMAAGLAFLYWVAKKTTPPEVQWKKPPIWQIIVLLSLVGFIIYLVVGPHRISN